jgi:hypothetical protein
MSKLEHIKSNIRSLEGEMRGLNEQLDLNPEDLLPPMDLLDGISDIQIFDYEKELSEIQIDCNETLSCLSSLYLKAEDVEMKNINNIIMNDAHALADLKFSLSCSKRGMVNLMKNIDMGLNDPELYKSLSLIQKEIRDTIKLVFDIQKKMKEFYRDIKTELDSLNKGDDDIKELTEVKLNDDEEYVIIDMEKIHNELNAYRNKDKVD